MTNLNILRTFRNLFVSFKCKHEHILNLNACKKPVFFRVSSKSWYFQQKQRTSFKAGDSSWSRMYWKLIILIKQREISYVNRSQDMSRIDRSKHSHSLFRNTQLQQFSFWLHPSTLLEYYFKYSLSTWKFWKPCSCNTLGCTQSTFGLHQNLYLAPAWCCCWLFLNLLRAACAQQEKA